MLFRSQNRDGINGALFKTTDTLNYLVDFAFLMSNSVQRNIRLEGRSGKAKCDATCFHIGGALPDTPCLAVGDTYSADTKLAVGSYTSPGTNALSVIGNVSMPGYMFCAGFVSATGTKITSTGQVSYTVARVSGYATGVWAITFASAHPLGSNCIVNLTVQGANGYISPSPNAPTSTTFQPATYQQAPTTLMDTPFYFMV